jgi:hypothetical protein
VEAEKKRRGRPKGSKTKPSGLTNEGAGVAILSENKFVWSSHTSQKLTPEVAARILEAVRVGCYFSSAAACAGIHVNTLNNWMKWGENGQEPYASFRTEMLLAEEACEEELIKMWKAHMPKNWQAIATFLERRKPEKWSRRDISKIENQTDIRMQVMYVNEWRGDPQIIDVTALDIEGKDGGNKHDSESTEAEGQDGTIAEAPATSDSGADKSSKV